MMIAAIMLAAATPAQPAYKPRPISAADQAEIKRQADLKLRDGPSTRWQWPKRLHPGIYCSELNSKNSFGAYTGWIPFFYTQNELFIVGRDDDRLLYDAFCSSGGYIPTPEYLRKRDQAEPASDPAP